MERSMRRRKVPNESLVMRLFVYAVFVMGTVTLILAVAIGSSHWLAPLVAVIVTIWPTIMFYLREQERQDIRETVRGAQQTMGRSNFDFSDDDDPTQPPTPKVIQ